MKKHFAALLAAGTLCLSLCLPVSGAEPKTALAYDFNRTDGSSVEDSSGNGRTLRLGKGCTVLKTEFGSALQFNGSPDGLAVSDSASRPAPLRMDEISCGFHIRFDKKGTPAQTIEKADFGLFDCVLDSEGRVTVTLFAKPADMLGPKHKMRSRDSFETGKWYHVEFNYSNNKRRAALYIDGKYQAENDNPDIPELYAPPAIRFGSGFSGAIGDLRFYEAPLDSPWLSPANKSENDFRRMKSCLANARKSSSNPSFASWCGKLEQETDSLFKSGLTTAHQWASLENNIINAEKIGAAMSAAGKGAVAGGVVTAYTVPAISQEVRTPYDLPKDGAISGSLEIIAAQGEYESASFLVIPFCPVKAFNIKVSDLKCGNSVISSSAVDPKLVKRWYRCGGAWLTYHGDKRGRFLTPDLLLNDDTLIKVDEFRQTNEIRLDYPDGSVYLDVSRHGRVLEPLFEPDRIPFKDAPFLRDVVLPEAGRNQQYWLTVHVPENAVPGLYKGIVSFYADGKAAGSMDILLRVLPFQLPEARTNYDINKIYYGNFSAGMAVQNNNASEERILAEFKQMKAHNMLYPSGARMGNSKGFEAEVRSRKAAGLPLRPIFSGSATSEEWNKTKPSERTSEVFEKLMSDYSRRVEDFLKKNEAAYGHRDIYMYGIDEANSYASLYNLQEPTWTVIKRLGGRVRATGMGLANLNYVADIQDMIVRSQVSREEAEYWHAMGGLVLNYGRPFPSSENPLTFRRRVGMWMYKNNYDGTMIHGFATTRRFNEFCDDPDGGNYRNFGIVYPSSDGVINSIAFAGLREAFDDIRYMSYAKMLALKAIETDKEELQREGRRQLVWMSRVSADRGSLDYLRIALTDRILIMLDLYKKNGVKLP